MSGSEPRIERRGQYGTGSHAYHNLEQRPYYDMIQGAIKQEHNPLPHVGSESEFNRTQKMEPSFRNTVAGRYK
jgi:hypothetical protein